jgi:hypothetical protein
LTLYDVGYGIQRVYPPRSHQKVSASTRGKSNAVCQYCPSASQPTARDVASEFIIAPILAEVRELLDKRFALFFGIDFTVDVEKGLNGECDFLFSRSPEQLLLRAPVISVVEARNESFKYGIAQACAEMLAAQVFNEREGQPLERIYGCVTTGDVWQFLKLEADKLFVDTKRYDLEQLPQILGIFCFMLESQAL